MCFASFDSAINHPLGVPTSWLNYGKRWYERTNAGFTDHQQQPRSSVPSQSATCLNYCKSTTSISFNNMCSNLSSHAFLSDYKHTLQSEELAALFKCPSCSPAGKVYLENSSGAALLAPRDDDGYVFSVQQNVSDVNAIYNWVSINKVITLFKAASFVFWVKDLEVFITILRFELIFKYWNSFTKWQAN